MLVASMIPIALGTGPGSGGRASMAKVIIGGQMLCLLLTLLVTPISYAIFDDWGKGIFWRKQVKVQRLILFGALSVIAFTGCQTSSRPGAVTKRRGDEIVAAGQFVHTGTRVVLWLDPGGYDAYRVERRFSPLEESDWEHTKEVKGFHSPNRYGLRRAGLTTNEIERLRGGGWDLPTLQKVVDQFVLHFDVCGTSRQCFNILQDHRDLSVHFLLDLDGTLYQTLDLKERAWHATTSNDRSIGIEIANMGAYRTNAANPFAKWYQTQGDETRITIPEAFGSDTGILTKGFVGHPARSQPVTGIVQRQELIQYDFTPQQYQALIKLTATLSKLFPKLRCDYPRDAAGKLIAHKLPDPQLDQYQGVLGHFHIQTNKVDPGPAFQWDLVIEKARKLRRQPACPAGKIGSGYKSQLDKF
jgi:N-acetyl-anhydromuramyl-L-alanine amidase AmpD